MIHNNKPYEIRDVKPIENDVTYLAVGVSYLNSCVVNYNPKHALTYTTLVNQFIDSLWVVHKCLSQNQKKVNSYNINRCMMYHNHSTVTNDAI